MLLRRESAVCESSLRRPVARPTWRESWRPTRRCRLSDCPFRHRNSEASTHLLSTAQMPGDVPVATMAVGMGGARNAGLFAVQILAVADTALAAKFAEFKESLQAKIAAKDARLTGDASRRCKIAAGTRCAGRVARTATLFCSTRHCCQRSFRSWSAVQRKMSGRPSAS